MTPRRMRAAGALVAAGHLALGLLASAWLGVPGAPLFFGLCAAISLVLALAVAPLLRPRRPRRDDGPPGGSDPPDEPPWWPEFERAMRDWTDRERPRA